MLGCRELWQLVGALCSSHDGFGGFERLVVLGRDLCFPVQYRGTADLALSVRCLTHRK